MKRLVVIGSLFAIITLLVVLFILRSRQLTTQPTPRALPTATPIASPLPQPSFPTDPLLPSPAYRVDAITDTFPTSLPVFVSGPPPSLQAEAARLTKVFAVVGTPIIDTAIDGIYYLWPGNASLMLGPDGSRVTYTAPAPTTDQLLPSDSLYVSAASSLVSSVSPGHTTRLSSTRYFSPRITDLNFTDRTGATGIQLGYTTTLGGFPLIASDPKSSETTLRYGANRALLHFKGYLYPQFVSRGVTPIISLQAAIERLLAGRGAVLSAESPIDLNAHDTKWYQVALASVSRAGLAYYYDFTKKQLSPVFLFTGVGIDKTTGNQVDIITAVSAVP